MLDLQALARSCKEHCMIPDDVSCAHSMHSDLLAPQPYPFPAVDYFNLSLCLFLNIHGRQGCATGRIFFLIVMGLDHFDVVVLER